MMKKIEWYREVLALEPGSKVFFPLAGALVQNGEKEKAVEVLRRGLELHPEYLEARIFLIQLLHERGEREAYRAELADVLGLVAAYPGFWEAWSEHAGEGNPDLGIMLRYVAAALERPGLMLRHLLEASLAGIRNGVAVPDTASSVEAPACPEESEPAEQAENIPAAGATRANVPEAPAVEESADAAPVLPVEADRRKAEPEEAIPDEAVPDEGDSPEDGVVEEATVRTRSMAEVLAEQGDVAGALEIYRELAAAASDPREREALQARIDALELKAGESCDAVPDEREPDRPEKAGMRHFLENLAERLEARAR